MPVTFHGLNDREHFLVVNLVVLLWRLELATVEGNRMEYSIRGVSLRDDGTQGIVGGVRFKHCWERGIKVAKDRSGSESHLELFKCGLGSGVPMEPVSFLEERGYRRDNLTEIFDETTIEVSKAEEDAYIMHRLRPRPGGDGADFRRVHLYSVRANDVPQEPHFLFVKLAFARLQIQFCLLKSL